jgi:hypothetical protein
MIIKKNPTELIDEVRTGDKETARSLINDGVQNAQGKWIEAPIIVEALALEIIDIVRTTQDDEKIAHLLRALASSIDKTSSWH